MRFLSSEVPLYKRGDAFRSMDSLLRHTQAILVAVNNLAVPDVWNGVDRGWCGRREEERKGALLTTYWSEPT